MTQPFENDTSAIIKKISLRSIHSSKLRNIFTITTIAMAAALLTAILLWGFGTRQENINIVKDTAQIVYRGLSERQGNKLYGQDEIEWVGEALVGPSERVNDTTINFSYGNAEVLASQQMRFKGKIPHNGNEIMLSEAFLKVLDYDGGLGQTIQISFENGTAQEFILTGIWSSAYEVKGAYLAFVSKEYLNKQAGSVLPMDYYISLKNAPQMSENEAADYASSLAEKLNIADSQIVIRSDYFMQLNDTKMGVEMVFYILVGILTLLGAGIVIYSIFYIAIAGNIRSYGQLRTIGATQKQIKRIVRREGEILAAIGIPLGLLTGNIIGYLLIPGGWSILSAIFVSVGTGLFTLLIVAISIHAPVKKAANVSAIKAVRYSPYHRTRNEMKKRNQKITPFSLAKMNLFRSKVKSMLTILSLSIGGILLVTLSSALISHNGEAETRETSFPVGEFKINLNANQSWDTAKVSLTALQKQGLFNDDFAAQLEGIDGVEGIKRWYYTDAAYRVNGGSDNWIQGFSREEQQNLEKNLLAGTVNYDDLVEGNGIVLLEERMEKAYEMEAALGDTVEVDYENAAGGIITKAYTIMGVVSGYSYAGFSKCFSIPERLMSEATGLDYTGTISVITEKEKYKSVEAALRQLISGKPKLTLDTFDEELNSLNSMYQYTFGVMLIVAVIITCFSLINLVNTTVTSFLSRKQEFAILQAVGLSQRQLLKMLRNEGFIYSLGATLVTAVVGTGLGFWAVNTMKSANPYFSFTFPWAVLAAYLSAISIVQLILFSFTMGTLKRQPLAERIRSTE